MATTLRLNPSATDTVADIKTAELLYSLAELVSAATLLKQPLVASLIGAALTEMCDVAARLRTDETVRFNPIAPAIAVHSGMWASELPHRAELQSA